MGHQVIHLSVASAFQVVASFMHESGGDTPHMARSIRARVQSADRELSVISSAACLRLARVARNQVMGGRVGGGMAREVKGRV